MEASYIIFRIAPYYENFGKRVIKSPKLYFFDVGLVSYLIEIETISQMSRDPLRGHLVENLVVLELVKSRLNKGLDPNLYYFRDSRGNEVDLLYKQGAKLVPIEIKSSKSFSRSFLKGLKYFEALASSRATSGWVIYAGSQEYTVDGVSLLNYKHCSKITESGS